jgi:Bacterial HORMA domain 2
MGTYVYSQTYTLTHSIVFLSDSFRNTLREVIRENGLSPERLMQDWGTVERGIKTWLGTRHLNSVVVEFFKPGSSTAMARWDFPVEYTGSGVDDDMWLDKSYLRQLVAKAARPSSDCAYRVVLGVNPGAPAVAGLEDCSYLSTGSLSARKSGTVIASGHLTASATYWR